MNFGLMGLRSLLSYTEAEHYYVAALKLHPSQSACWGVAECKLARRELRALIQFLDKRNRAFPELSLERCPNFWFYQAKAHRYLQSYDQAGIKINHALTLDPDSVSIRQEKECIDRCQDFIKQRHQQYSKTTLTYDEASYYHRHGPASGQKRHYNILSIDGGGIRGIVPAVVLSEIERRTHRPISYSFNQLSGTSTGGIIALGLSMPELVESGDLPYRPKFQAAGIFTRASRLKSFFGLRGPKYSNQGRSHLFRQYFGDIKLSQLLTEVAVPACNQTQSFTTTYFTRSEARANPDKNFSVLDVAMATTAAPTYFPEHKIKVGDKVVSIEDQVVLVPKMETFIDGGVQANNPAGYAYKQALDQGIDPASIYLWSLGTGDCIHNSLTPQANQGKLFWAQNLCHYLGAQQNNVDDELRSIMAQRYHRWQFWMESPIDLDDHSDETKHFLVNAGHELIEELDSDETRSLNRLVEHLTPQL